LIADLSFAYLLTALFTERFASSQLTIGIQASLPKIEEQKEAVTLSYWSTPQADGSTSLFHAVH
jgi:hypothetical protein